MQLPSHWASSGITLTRGAQASLNTTVAQQSPQPTPEQFQMHIPNRKQTADVAGSESQFSDSRSTKTAEASKSGFQELGI